MLVLDDGTDYRSKVTLISSTLTVQGDAVFSDVDVTNGRLIGSYRNAENELVVDGYTFELDRSGSWSKVHVLNGGVITTPEASSGFVQGVSITADEIEVEAGARIDVSGRGLLGTTAIGSYTGGSYGGQGGRYQSGSTNAAYGDFREPKDFGTGGRYVSNNFTRGGGSLSVVANVLKLDGAIRANGQHAINYGSGSGGSLLLKVKSLSLGDGARIEADGGGSSSDTTYGGGGGGRVAIYFETLEQGTLHEQVLARGGLSKHAQPGAAGSVYLKNLQSGAEELVFNNTGVSASAPVSHLDLREINYAGAIFLNNAQVLLRGDFANTQVHNVDSKLFRTDLSDGVNLEVDNYTLILGGDTVWERIHVLNGGVVTSLEAAADFAQGITITADEVVVDAGSRIDVSGKGLLGTTAIGTYTGGSYGGSGGVYNGSTNESYGDFREPTDFGSGGRGSNTFTRGGGALELRAGTLKLDGQLLANGQYVSSQGSGSGGSLLLRVDAIELGSEAKIQANGGGTNTCGACTYGGGGGGRIAVHYRAVDRVALVQKLQARGGPSWSSQQGAAGTLYVKDLETQQAELIIDNTGIDKARAATTRLDVSDNAEFADKLTVINANIELVGAKLGEVSFADSTASLNVAEVLLLQANNSQLTQVRDIAVTDLLMAGGSWIQAGHALNAERYTFDGSTLDLSGAFSGVQTDLIVDGFTVTLNQSATWRKVRVLNGGLITTPVASDSFTQAVVITADEIEVDASSRIDVSGKGQLGTTAIGTYTGGSYGGSGGVYNGSTNESYGDFREPTDFGSGGRGSNTFTRGGGALELRAGTLKLDGQLLANGQYVSSQGSGSGGSLLLRVDAIELGSEAKIQANGGGTNTCGACTYGGGGGGRIAVHFQEVDRATLLQRLQVRGGLSWNYQQGGAGTLYLNDRSSDQAELIIDNTSVDRAKAATTLLDLGSEGELKEKLTVNNANVELLAGQLGLVQAAGSHLLQRADLNVADLRLDAGLWNQAGFALSTSSYRFSGATLQLSGSFNQVVDELLVDNYTVELSDDRSWQKIRLINGGVITTPAASETFTQGITLTADEIEVDASSRIDVSAKGLIPGADVANYCGGSHGGLGGSYGGCQTNAVYGDYLAPVTFGMGGRRSGTSGMVRGGGALKLVARSLHLDGQLLANGEAYPSNSTAGGGAGGSLWVDTQVLLGSATTRIQANGGAGRNSGGSGGGGRIAIYYAGLQGFDVLSQISVAGGVRSGSATAAEQGSLHLENRVVSTAVAGADVDGSIGREINAFTVDFINAVDPETVTASAVALSGPQGAVAIQSITALNSVRYRFELESVLSDGLYELRVGPGIRSVQGRGMDQNGNGIEDEPGDVFVRQFVIDRQAPLAPVVTSPLVAPAINSINVRRVTLTGERESQTAILVNGVVQVALGNGAWTISDYVPVEGDSDLQIQARDAAGNLSPASVVKLSVDSTRPSFQQYSHGGSINTVPDSVWVRFVEAGSGLDFANSSLVLKRGNDLIAGQLSLEGNTLRLTPSSTLLEGQYSVAVSLKDRAGNLSTTTFSFTLDYTPPLAPVLAAYPAVTTVNVLRLSITKESGSSLILRNAAEQAVGSMSGGGTNWNWDINLVPGDNLFTLEQRDVAGNVSPRTSIQVRFDNEAPGPVLFSIDPQGSGTEVKLAWPNYDEVANGNDIQQYRIYSAVQPFTRVAEAQLTMTVPGGTRQAVVKNLPRAETRHFAVVAVDQQGLLVDELLSQAATPQDIQPPADASGFSVRSFEDRLELSWQASVNLAGDLSGYVLYVGEGGVQRIDLPLPALVDGLSYSLTGLAAGSAHPLRLVAVDGDGNESAGVRNPGITWLGNPQDLQLQALSNRFEAQWKAVQPSEWVSGYRLYVADEPFTSIQGMSPKAKVGVGQVSTSIGGLLNNKAYHVAVTVVNASGGENPQVQSLSVKPVADSDGPELTALTWHDGSSNQDIRAGGVLAQLGELRIQAKDESGIGRVELSLDGQPMGMATRAGDYYRQAWSLVQVADGPHQLQVSLYDTLDNQSQLEVAVQVELAPPAAPSLSLQSKASKTNAPQQVLIVRGQANSLAQISHNGSDLGDLVVLDGSGQAQVPLTLIEGDNQLTARLRYGSRERFGAASEPLRVNLDSALPDAPGSLQAIAKAQGIVNLSWAAVNGVSGYDLYAANQPFTSVTDAGVSKLNSKALTSSSYQHQTTADGTYYYRVSSVNTLGSQSALSVPQSVTADSTPPKVEEALYSSLGQVSGDGRFAPGRVDVRLRMSEALRNAPFFSLDVPQGASIPVRLTQAANDPLSYLGSFDLSAAVPSGLLYARVSAHDPVGNEGTEVVEGKTLRVDTQGPDLQQLSLLPESPVENLVDGNQGREVQVVLRLSKDPIALPELTPRLDGQALVSQPGPLALSLDAQSQPGAPIYTGRFRLPVDAGQQSVQLLSFDYRASDDLGNTSERILGRRDFQVYQGDLPPLDIPQGLSGKALSAGRVALSWKEVAEASAYQVYRRGDADSDFVALGRVREQAFEDNLPVAGLADGAYHYRVASIREHDDKEAVSLPSDSIKVDVLSQAPGAPTDLSIELNGAGIVLRWLAPEAGQVVSYNLYRANVGQDQPIDIEGLAPLQSDIPERIALDSRPSDVEHAYTVTAVDAAGNESAPATSVYLNAGLLPVRDLSVHLAEGQAPQLQWDHSGQDVVGYNVYAGTSSEKLNETLITSTSFVDHRVALPFSAERQYSVTAVDAQGVESLPHTLLLPALKAELRAEQKLERGVFNQLHYRVLNSGSVAVKRLRLRVDVSSEGQVKQHLSDYFDVGAGSVSEVAVVVAGYKDLPGVVPLSVEIVQAPQEGESVSIQRNETITAGENTLLVQLLPDEFTRGGSGSVRVRLENPSAIATELITARSNGNQVSDEMRLILEDLQGNVLASQSVKASVGNGLITVRDGRTVARVGGYDVLETGPFSIDVPVAAPDRVRVRLEADFLHYQTGLPGELKLGGLRSSHELSLVEAPYRGEITAISPEQVQAGDSVTIRGRALGRDDAQPLAGVALKLVLNVRGFEHVVSVNTDEQGVFEYVFDTASSDSGEYLLSLIHPSIQLRPQHGRFLVQGAAFSPASVNTSFPRNYEQTVTVVVEAGHDSPLANVRLEYVQPDGSSGLPTGLKVQQGGALNLIAKQRGNLTLRISGDNGAAESGLLDYRIVADGLERPIGQVRIQYKLVQAQPLVRVAPTQIRTGVSREAEQVEQVTLSNPGQDVLRNVRVSLLDEQGGAAPGWVSLRTAERLGDLPVSASQLIGVAFSPDAAVAEGDYYFTLRIESDNAPVANVPMSASVTQSGQGGVIFQVEDIYTGTLNEQGQRVLGLKGTKIKLQNRNVLSSEFSATTDDRGQVLLENIPAGEYSYRISAWDHDDLSGQLWIKPGVVGDERVFLMSKLVTVEWSVKEITVEDRYEIILNATFKTNVPTALVMIEPLSINLPMMRKGDVFQGELTLTNYGLIRADKVQASLPTGDARTRIEYLRTVPETLEAGDVLVVPYRIVALQSFDPDDELNGAAGCWSFNYQGVVNYESQCVNGQIIPGRANVAWSANGRTGSCGGGGGGSIGGGGASGWGGWGGSWGNGFIPRPTPLTSTKQCVPPPDCDNGNCGGGNGGGD